MEIQENSVVGDWLVREIFSGGVAKCECACGTRKFVRLSYLRTGRSKSCGCKRGENVAQTRGFTGVTKLPEYKIWCAMKNRCLNPKQKAYPRYGGRGITICDRWVFGEGEKTGFECFYDDIGSRPSSKHSINRIDNDDGYSPENCEWTTAVEQAANTRANHWIEYKGEKMILADAIRKAGVEPKMAANRLSRGWSVERALNTPADNYDKERCIMVDVDGVQMNLKAAAKARNIKYLTVYMRIQNGWPVEEALSTPARKISHVC